MRKLFLCIFMLMFAFSAFAEDSATQVAVNNIVTEIGLIPAMVAAIGVATLAVTLAVKTFSWIRAAIK